MNSKSKLVNRNFHAYMPLLNYSDAVLSNANAPIESGNLVCNANFIAISIAEEPLSE